MDGDKIKNFFLFHVEKMILAVVIGVSGFMVYKGLQQENILEKHQPERLTQDANQVRAEVDEDHNDQILPERIPDFNINDEINRRRTAVNPNGYPFPPLKPTNIASTIRRKDPELLPPLALQMHGVLASIAVRSATEEWPLKELEAADPIEKKVEPEKKESRKRGFQRGALGEDMMEMFEEDYGDMMEEEDMEDIYSQGTAGGGATRRLSREHDHGVRPTNTKNLRTDKTQYPVPGAGWFIAGSAVVPNKMLYESYKKALSEADNYEPVKRDYPLFLNFIVQRADVTTKPVDQLQESDWVDRNDLRKTAFEAATYWAGFAPEMVPKDYRDSALTMWLPPVLLDDYTKLAVHPLIPMIPWREVLEKERQKEIDIDPDEPLDITKFNFGGVAGAARMFDGPGDDMEDDYGNGFGGGTGPQKDPPEYKLIRFYDFYKNPKSDPNTPLPGHKYVYRVRYAVDDPNFPANPMLQPKGSTMDADAYKRFLDLAARAVQEKKRDSQRWSQWSSPSEPVSLPGFERVYVGPVKAPEPRTYTAGNRVVEYSTDQAKASIVVSKYNTTYRAWSPMFIEDITAGSVLSKEAEAADIVDPITLEVKKLENPKIISRTTVIDIDGGAPLGIQEGEGMFEPGLMLLFDENGQLRVHDEVDDLESYRIKSFADERGE